MEYDLELAQKALDKYNALYDNALYMDITADIIYHTIDEDAELRVIVSDCALLLCGHPGVQQSRWVELLQRLTLAKANTRMRVVVFLARFIPQAAA